MHKTLALPGGFAVVVATARARVRRQAPSSLARPVAVLINYAEYERVKETIDILSDSDLMQQIHKSQAFYDTGQKGLSFDEVFGEPLVPRKKRRR